jgi:plastocyanin
VKALVALAAVATLASAPGALAADQTVQAVDGTAADNYNNRWAPVEVTVRAGETVTWSFAGTAGLHNVASNSVNWSYRNGDPAVAPPPGAFRFDTPGVYSFWCEIHTTTMVGTVNVTDASGAPPPPPPPPPPSEQPWPNEQPAPTVFDVADRERPRISRVRAVAVRGGARVRFRLSERARVTVRFRLAGLTVKTTRRQFGAGTHRLTVRDRRLRGGYRLDLRARDFAGNRSRVAHARLTVRG